MPSIAVSLSVLALNCLVQLPFAFPIDLVAVQQDIHVGFNGNKDIAILSIPKTPSETNVETRVLSLAFSNVPFAVNDGQEGNFEQFLATTTTSQSISFELSGSVIAADAKTGVGLLTIKDIAFDLSTTLAGLQGLNARPAVVSNLDVNHGFTDFLLIKVDTELFNPRCASRSWSASPRADCRAATSRSSLVTSHSHSSSSELARPSRARR